jgi:hypothetical protein
MKESFLAMDEGYSMLIYPEDLDHMYNNVYLDFLPGFVFLARTYFQRTGKDIPVVPCYFSYQFNRIIIGEPISVNKMLDDGKTKEEVAVFFRDKVNGLFMEHLRPIIQAKEAKYARFDGA